MRTITKTLITTFLLNVALNGAPPVLNVYVIPFDNIKNDVAIGWLSDALSEMINSELSNHDRIYLKDQSGLEEVMTNRSLLLQQRPGTKNLLFLGKYERTLDKISISLQLIDIKTWDELDRRKVRGGYNDVSGINRSLKESINSMMTPYLPKPTKSPYPTLTDGKRMRTPPSYAEKALDMSSAIDLAIDDLEKKLDINIGARGEVSDKDLKEDNGEWVLDISTDNYENNRPENDLNTAMMVDVLNNLMDSPYQVSLDRPTFNYDSKNKKEFEVVLNVNYKLKGDLIKDMLKSLPYSGLKQDGSLTIFYFNKDKYNFPANISKKIQIGEYRTIPVIQLQDSNKKPLVLIVDTADKNLHRLTSNKIIYKPFHYFSPLINFSVGGWSMQVALETVDIPVEYIFNMDVSTANSISRISLKFIPENELNAYLGKIF